MNSKSKPNAAARQLELALKSWKVVKPVDIAKAAFSCVEGRGDKLLSNPGNSKSVWGKIVKAIGNTNLDNNQLNRLWASAAYHSNLKGIKVHILQEIQLYVLV